MKEVVVPVVRPVDVHPFGMDRPAGAARLEELVLKQQRARRLGRIPSALMAGLSVVFDEAPDRRQALMERGVRGLGVAVAVPSAVGPLRAEQHLDEVSDAAVAMLAEPGADCERIALHRRMAPLPTSDDERFGWGGDPLEDMVGGAVRLEAGPRHTQLDE